MKQRILSFFLTIIIVISQVTVTNAIQEKDFKSSWAKNSIQIWLDEGYLELYEDGTFRPKQMITRGEFVQVINKAFYIPKTNEVFHFSDVSTENSFFNDIQKAKDYGYISGYPDGTFRPNSYITREEAATIIGIMLGVEKHYNNELLIFDDYNKIKDWSKEYVNFLVSKKAINGYPDRTFKPTNNISREEAITILKGIHDKANEYTGADYLVLDKGIPAKDAQIKVYSEDFKVVKEGKVDEDGKVILKDMSPGKYFVNVETDDSSKILSDEINIRDKFVLFREGEVKESIEVQGFLVNEKDERAPENMIIVFEADNKTISNTIKDGAIKINLLPNKKYKVYVKTTESQYIGEIQIDNKDTDIGKLVYNSKITVSSSKDKSSNSNKEQKNDKEPPIISLDIDEEARFDDQDLYLVEELLSDISGKIVDDSEIETINYRIDFGKLKLVDKNIKPNKNFKLDDITLLNGVNTLTVTAVDTNGNVGSYSVSLFNILDENNGDVELDIRDTDGEGLLNYQEEYFGTDIDLIDTDADGLTDYEEISITETNPLKKDTDSNGINDADEDFDSDGLTNLEEIRLNGNPRNEDTDFDEVKDSKERDLGTKLDEYDSDEDGLSDSRELELGTNPLNPDTNGNGILDGDEIYSVEKTVDLEFADENVIPSISINIPGNAIDSLSITALRDDDLFLPKDIPGYLGAGYEFECASEFETATMTFKFNPKFKEIDDFEPAIYYFDEENQMMVYLENQLIDLENNSVSVDVEHFSTYILIDKNKYEKVWETELELVSDADINKPLDIVLVIDSSGSMSWNDPNNIRITAAKGFVDKIREDDRIAVVDFDYYSYLLSPFSSDKAVLKNAIDMIDSDGGTSLTAGMKTALSQFNLTFIKNSLSISTDDNKRALEETGENGLDRLGNPINLGNDSNVGDDKLKSTTPGSIEIEFYNPLDKEQDDLTKENISSNLQRTEPRKFIIFLTDGDGSYDRGLNQTAADNNIIVHTIGLGESVNDAILEEIATITGGKYFHSDSAEELITEFEKLSDRVIDIHKDSDADGLVDYYENNLRYSNGILIGTDPFNNDTDGDGLLDGEEIIVKTETLVKDGKPFIKVYATLKSHPKMVDTDGDGFDDYVETKDSEVGIESQNFTDEIMKSSTATEKYESKNPLKWNVSDRDLAMASSIAYSYLKKETKIKNLSSALKNEISERFMDVANISELDRWQVKDTWYAKGGLQIVAFTIDDNIVVAHRGTEPKGGDKNELWMDWYNNGTTYLFGLSTQTPATKKFIKNTMKNNQGKKFYITGHSLGGHLAYNAAAEGIHYDKSSIKGIVTFNGLGLVYHPGDMWDDIQLVKLESEIRNYMVKGDPVSKGFLGFTTLHYGKTFTYKKSLKSPDEHNLYTFFEILKRNN